MSEGAAPRQDLEPTVIPESPPFGSDEIAQKEASAIADKKLFRDDRMQGHIHVATICLVWGFVAGIIAMGAVWLYHLLMPLKFAFLSENQIDKLQTCLMTAIGSSFITDRAKKLNK